MKRFILLFLFVLGGSNAAFAMTAEVSLAVDTAGKISAEVRLKATPSQTTRQSTPFEPYILALPFKALESTKLQSPEDVPAAILKRGDGYTLLSVAIPSSRSDSIIRMPEAFSLAESPEGKAYLELDLGYTFVSQAERQLISSGFAVLPDKVSIVLPRDYDDVELGFSPTQFQRVNRKQYVLDIKAIGANPAKAWLVFPNPMQAQLQTAKIILAAIIGIFSLLLHVPALKEQRLSWSLAVLAISSLVCGLILYYSFSLSKRLDFVEWAAGSAPHVIYGLASSLYLLFVARKQALITGRITLDGAPIQIAEVQLWRVINGERQQDKKLETLTEGRYSFRTRPRAINERFEVTAIARGTDEVKSDSFQIEARKQIELKAMDLHWRQQPVSAVGSPP